jgi:hypothetical protein
MDHRTVRYLIWGQVSLFGFILLCTILNPHFLIERNEGGLSNYGVYRETVLPYSLAFGLSGIITFYSAYLLPKSGGVMRQLKWTLILLGILNIATLLSTYPYHLNNFFNTLHDDVGLMGVIIELILSLWFAIYIARSFWGWLLAAIQIIGFILVILILFNYLHILFIAEIISGVAFGAQLVRSVNTVLQKQG